ncbi:MAG: hypothetical protein K940chlam9_01279 [Chlamydiae bacterium]|nr:hypothetical protein [Chlamydiota bacterium]
MISNAFVVAESEFFKKFSSSEMYFRVQSRPVFFNSDYKEFSVTQDVVENLRAPRSVYLLMEEGSM